jgi:hypothetical protein
MLNDEDANTIFIVYKLTLDPTEAGTHDLSHSKKNIVKAFYKNNLKTQINQTIQWPKEKP